LLDLRVWLFEEAEVCSHAALRLGSYETELSSGL